MEYFHPYTDDIIKLVVSIICGSLIGIEREYRNKSAGFRTIILICLGSTLFTIVSQGLGTGDRIAANIVTGIGFIGAGVIFRQGLTVSGLTTAAVIWMVAAVGMSIGISDHSLGLVSTLLVIIILSVFHAFENLLDKIHHKKTWFITLSSLADLEKVEESIRSEDLKVRRDELSKHKNQITAKLLVFGKKNRIYRMSEKLVSMEMIDEIRLQ